MTSRTSSPLPETAGPDMELGRASGGRRPRLVVVGSANLDLVLSVPSLPRPGETVMATGLLRAPGGKGANQAVAAARLGADVRLVAAVGDDPAGSEILQALRGDGLGDGVEVVPGAPTGTAVVVVDAAGDNTVTVVPGANALLEPEPALARAGIEGADALLLQLEVPLPVNVAAARAARAAGVDVIVNAAPSSSAAELTELLELTDVLVVNKGEAATVAASDRDPAARLLEAGPRLVIVTLGALGSQAAFVNALSGTAQARLLAHAPRVETVDTVGAGDAFCAGVAVGRAEGLAIGRVLEFANACGALATTVRGAQPSFARREGVLALLAQPVPGRRGRR